MHVGVGNLNVVSQVGRIIADVEAARPNVLMTDGDLLTLVQESVSE